MVMRHQRSVSSYFYIMYYARTSFLDGGLIIMSPAVNKYRYTYTARVLCISKFLSVNRKGYIEHHPNIATNINKTVTNDGYNIQNHAENITSKSD